jgi:hypothetical protein
MIFNSSGGLEVDSSERRIGIGASIQAEELISSPIGFVKYNIARGDRVVSELEAECPDLPGRVS